ncbi:hypothetical protein [Deinococcus peraridilitoris]|uniref:Uncharacterized protein n=1 Tax=Deinococcus peraridilitoris (strain DSM 19664 / LMG 22246 / CIP 109416 / KR-200) TaxID=937777 RepID=L0A8Q4_DEIPD|nr:hypothetical protein [Deinococcus peraridilitoris]AFZ69537.1 hypothetical protein Deipe_4170 [Deinococcus peraridilitoris DSM 19664]
MPHIRYNDYANPLNQLGRKRAAILQELESQADANGLTKINLIDFGERWIRQPGEPASHPSSYFQRAQSELIALDNHGFLELISLSRRHKETTIIKVKPGQFERKHYATIELVPSELRSPRGMFTLGRTLHLYLWLHTLAVETDSQDGGVTFDRIEYASTFLVGIPDIMEQLEHIAHLGRIEAAPKLQGDHVTIKLKDFCALGWFS